MLRSVLPRSMAEGGHTVFQAESGVRLITHVPAVFLTLTQNPVAGGNLK
jgi:RNA:NAD 2'-phosphotransferase (TPT1/KptA family)